VNRKVPISVGENYHLYNRGVDKRTIFNDTDDYRRFLALMYLCNSDVPVDMANLTPVPGGRTFWDVFEEDRGKPIVAIGAYVLMPNHFHILGKEVREDGLQTFMRKLGTGYAMYFNTKYERSGALFEGKYKSQHIDNDPYLRYAFSYIYMNPVKLVPGEKDWKENGIKDIRRVKSFLESYDYSSMPNHDNDPRLGKILQSEHFPKYYSGVAEMEQEISDWLSMKK
jgi:REP element-mobilizing transposase RayT